MGDNGNSGISGAYGHIPVLVDEVVGALRPHSPGAYVDATVGQGGHAERLLEASAPDGVVIGIDRDATALASARTRLARFGSRVQLLHGNFKDLRDHLRAVGVSNVDGVVLDLGVSSWQLADAGRGFSFAAEGPLDMRMDQTLTRTAADLVNELPESELADLIYRYGEERYAKRIARSIVRARRTQPLATTSDLVAAIAAGVPASARHGRIHFATRTFQALRIVVNDELEAIAPAVRHAAELLSPGGRLCVISFHSLEDRIAKWTIRELAQGDAPVLRVISKKPMGPTEAERQANPRSRSAKLRIAERLAQRRCA